MESNNDSDLAGTSFDEGLSNREVPKWVKSGGWVCAILATLPIFYFLFYPVVALLIFKGLEEPIPLPPLLEKSVIPIDWVSDKVELYDDYTEWLHDLIF